MVPGIPLASGSRNRTPHRSQAVARGPVNGSRARTADIVNAEPSPISATTASARRPATLAGYPGRLDEGHGLAAGFAIASDQQPGGILHSGPVPPISAQNTQIYEGTNQIQRMVMARQLLKG